MNFIQSKLNEEEWKQLEIKVSQSDLEVLELLNKSYNDESYIINKFQNLSSIIKIQDSKKDIHLFESCCRKNIEKIISKCKNKHINFKEYTLPPKHKKSSSIKKADLIRIENTINDKVELIKNSIEYIIFDIMKKLSSQSSKNNNINNVYYFISLKNIILNNERYINTYVVEFCKFVLNNFEENFGFSNILNITLEKCSKIIDNNKYFNIKTLTAYKHQTDIFNVFKKEPEKPKLIFYTSPTCSGKTLTPIGLSNEYKIVFLCASKHVGLQLARNLISMGRKIAFAFGCNSNEDIRLHYNSVNSYITKKSLNGRIYKKIDNLDGKKVEIIISDITSYEYAMNYICAFNERNKTMVFWDEPTISLDTEESILHNMIKNIWSKNKIPNIILSSATLPSKESLCDVCNSFMNKFGEESIIDTITSNESITNISLYNKNGKLITPHSYFDNYESFKQYVDSYDYKYNRLFPCFECAKFILFYCKSINIDVIKYFKNVSELNMVNIKNIYIDIIRNIKQSNYELLINTYNLHHNKSYSCGSNFITNDANTLTNGPSLFLTENIDNIVKFIVHKSGLKGDQLAVIQQNILFNEKINDSIKLIEREIEELITSKSNSDNDDNNKKNTTNEIKINESTSIDKLYQKINSLNSQLKHISLPYEFIPNTLDHYKKYTNNNIEYHDSDVYTSSIDDDTIMTIMNLTIDIKYKITLLMGIGLFIDENNYESEDYKVYINIVKQLTEDKRLYVVIANTDYIFGVNYQFSHCYLGKDIANITHEKIIQSIGRIGRKEKNKQFSFRFRSDEHVEMLFNISNNTTETKNLNILLS